MRLLTLSCLAWILAACEVFGPDPPGYEKTYPDAANYEQISLHHLTDPAVEPGFYNLAAYVVSIFVCPPEHCCYVPDGILLAQRKHAGDLEETFHLMVREPRQFELRKRYELSVKIEELHFKGSDTMQTVRRVELVGYSRAE